MGIRTFLDEIHLTIDLTILKTRARVSLFEAEGGLEEPRLLIFRFCQAAAMHVIIMRLELGIIKEHCTHPGIYHRRCLHLDNLLHELDAAHSHACRSRIPSLQYVYFDGCHIVPGGNVTSICNARKKPI